MDTLPSRQTPGGELFYGEMREPKTEAEGFSQPFFIWKV